MELKNIKQEFIENGKEIYKGLIKIDYIIYEKLL